MILAVGGVVPATPGTPGVVVTPNLPIIGAAVTAEMVTALVNAGIPAEPTYTLESSNVTKTLENGATEQTATVGELEIVTTHTVQEDGALKSVIKTGDITLKETVTSRDAEGHETVVTRETLGKDHTKVTVSEGATTTTVTSTADGAVSKAVSETVLVAGQATIKTVTTNIAADETTVTVLEKIGDDAEVQTASGTMTVNANTMQQTYLLDNTDGTSDEIYLYRDGTEVKVSKDDQGNFTKAYDTYEYNDGTKWEKLEQDNVLTETYTKTNGETEVTTENLTTGQFTITTSTKVDGVLVEAITGTGVKTKVGEPGSEVTTHVITQTEGNVPTGVIETRVYDRSTGYETTTSARDGVTLGVVVEGWDDSGNQLTKTFAYVDGVLSTETEVTTSDNNTVETTTIGAANANGVRAVEVTQSGTDAAGKVFSKIVGTGTESTVGEETTKSVTLSDESVLTEKTNLQGSLIERIIEDAEGDKQKDTWVDGQKATVYLDDSDQILADGSTFEAVDIGLTSVANFDLTSIVDGPIQDDSEVGFFDFADNDLAVIVASGNDNTEEVQTATNVGNYGGNSNQISEETTVDSLNFAVFNDLLDDYQSLYADVGGIA